MPRARQAWLLRLALDDNNQEESMLRRCLWSPMFSLSSTLLALDAPAQDKSAAVLTPSVEVTAIVPDTR